jgi:hypothetical protein
MRWNRQHWLRKRRPYPGVSRQMDADSLIDRLLRSADSAAAPSGLAPDVLAEEIGVKLREHGGVSRDTVVGRIGAGFRSGDNANLQVEHGEAPRIETWRAGRAELKTEYLVGRVKPGSRSRDPASEDRRVPPQERRSDSEQTG